MKYVEEKRYTENGTRKIIIAEIRLSDPCGNGHQDFSATCTIGEKRRGRYSADSFTCSEGEKWEMSGGGAAHEEIRKHFPHLEIFTRLHLCDFAGNPMHAIANGQYHMENNPDKGYHLGPLSDFVKGKITTDFNDAEGSFADKAKRFGIYWVWLYIAIVGKCLLEELTGDKFKCASVKLNADWGDKAYMEALEREFGFIMP